MSPDLASPLVIKAPWTDAQVEALRLYQADSRIHSYTAARRDADGQKIDLIPTRDGWVEVKDGPVVQNWALASSFSFAEWAARTPNPLATPKGGTPCP